MNCVLVEVYPEIFSPKSPNQMLWYLEVKQGRFTILDKGTPPYHRQISWKRVSLFPSL